MAQRFINKDIKSGLLIEHAAELMYMCMVDSSHTRMPRAMHMHDDRVEIVFIRAGRGSHIIAGRVYETQRGDVLIYNCGVLHDESANPNDSMSVYCCGFKKLKLRGLPPNHLTAPEQPVVLKSGDCFDQFEQLMNLLYVSANRYSEQFCNPLLQALIVLVGQISKPAETGLEDKRHDLSADIKNYIDAHYLEDIDLKSIAAELSISPFYLAHKFKSSVGSSPIQYLIRRRIGEAQSLLINSHFSVTEIATMVGYDNTNYFNTLFKKVVGMTPNGYRQHWTR